MMFNGGSRRSGLQPGRRWGIRPMFNWCSTD